MNRKWLKRTIVALSLLVEIYLLYHLPTVLLIGMFLIGRSDCTFAKTLEVASWKIQYLDTSDRMERQSQLLKRDGAMQLWSTPRGKLWMPIDRRPNIYGVLAEMEMDVYGTGPTGVREGDIVLDCGADIGTYTRLALNKGASLVVAIEPDLGRESCLERNFQKEIIDGRVMTVRRGVWDKEEILNLSHGVVTGSPEGESISLTTIDKLVTELKLDRVDFIKMDIEGSERKALAGAKGTLTQFKPRLAISSKHFADDVKTIPEIVSSMVPSYTVEHGPCAYLDGRICPHVIYFH